MSAATPDWGTTLKLKRDAAKLTQDELARRLTAAGVVTAMTSVSRWENGKATPSIHRRALIDRVLADAATGKHTVYVRSTGGRGSGHSGVVNAGMMEELEFVYSVTEGKGPLWDRITKCVSEVRQDIRQMAQTTGSGRKHG